MSWLALSGPVAAQQPVMGPEHLDFHAAAWPGERLAGFGLASEGRWEMSGAGCILFGGGLYRVEKGGEGDVPADPGAAMRWHALSGPEGSGAMESFWVWETGWSDSRSREGHKQDWVRAQEALEFQILSGVWPLAAELTLPAETPRWERSAWEHRGKRKSAAAAGVRSIGAAAFSESATGAAVGWGEGRWWPMCLVAGGGLLILWAVGGLRQLQPPP